MLPLIEGKEERAELFALLAAGEVYEIEEWIKVRQPSTEVIHLLRQGFHKYGCGSVNLMVYPLFDEIVMGGIHFEDQIQSNIVILSRRVGKLFHHRIYYDASGDR